MDIKFINSLSQLPRDNWQQVISTDNPLLSYEFFSALEESQSASSSKGWTPHHLLLNEFNKTKAIMPLYIKDHSWGEYVFDWDWADAYQRYGHTYYPKLVATIPFTPIPSDKLISNDVFIEEIIPQLTKHCLEQSINSWHILFTHELSSIPEDVYQRHTVQFHWFNRDYQHFDDFINTFTSRKRKNTRKERLSITQQNIVVAQLTGAQIDKKHLDYFYLTYQLTYLKRGHKPHLTYAFFQQIFAHLSDNILLIIASHQEEYVAAALFFFDENQLFGRYWGCSKSFENLHFELCYYQGIEFCIRQKIHYFNPGTQGEHKIQRGFEPVLTHSYHWIKEQEFRAPIKAFCQQEREQMKIYQQQCLAALPFKSAES